MCIPIQLCALCLPIFILHILGYTYLNRGWQHHLLNHQCIDKQVVESQRVQGSNLRNMRTVLKFHI